MKPSRHIIIGLIISVLLFLIKPDFFGWNILIVFVSSVLIDFDHVIGVMMYKGKLLINPIKVYHQLVHLPLGPYVLFHTAEFILCLAVVSIIFNYYFILIGFLMHIATDLIYDPKRWMTRTFWGLMYAQFIQNERFINKRH